MQFTRRTKRLSVVILLTLTLMLTLSVANAGTVPVPLFTDPVAKIDCAGGAGLTVTVTGLGEIGIELLVNGSSVGIESFFIEGTMTQTVNFKFPEQTGESVLFEFYGAYASLGARGNLPNSVLITSVLKNCVTGETEEQPSDGRFCYAAGEARAAVYGFRDGDSYGIEIWAIDANNQGQRVIRMTAGQIDEATKEGERTLLNSSIFNSVKLYRLEDGRFQINVGPAGEPKVHVCIFNAIPPTEVIKSTLSY